MQIRVQSFFISDQRNWPFDEFRSHLVTVSKIDQMRSAFGQTRSTIGQKSAHLAKRARDLPNVAHLVKFRAFDQLVKCAARLPKCADWSNAPYSHCSSVCSVPASAQRLWSVCFHKVDY